MKPEFVPGGECLEAGARELAVGDGHDRAIERTDAGRPEANVIDGALDVPHLEKIAEANRLIDDERAAGDDVLERLLGGKGDRNPADAATGQRRRGSAAEVAHHGKDHENHGMSTNRRSNGTRS